jgi:predicted ester cyclase
VHEFGFVLSRPIAPSAAELISISQQETEFVPACRGLPVAQVIGLASVTATPDRKGIRMGTAENKAIIGRWFTEFWGKTCNLGVVDELAAPDMLLKYSLHEPRRGRADIKAFMTDFRSAFPDLNFWGTADLIAEGDYVVGQWEGGGTHTGPAFSDFLMGSLPAASGRKMHFTGTTVLRIQNGKITQEIGLDDGVTALTQLRLLKAA